LLVHNIVTSTPGSWLAGDVEQQINTCQLAKQEETGRQEPPPTLQTTPAGKAAAVDVAVRRHHRLSNQGISHTLDCKLTLTWLVCAEVASGCPRPATAGPPLSSAQCVRLPGGAIATGAASVLASCPSAIAKGCVRVYHIKSVKG
jgi:hypothetical protein